MSTMHAMVSLALAACVACASAASPPPVGYNPVAALYGNGTYPWADKMVNWSSVFNVDNYSKDFDKAQAAAVKAGGGVVYFPAGTYTFSKNLELQSNVVIMGEPTTDPAKSGDQPGKLAPHTVFKCPDRSHLGIFNNDPKGTNLGIVNLDLDGCAVMLWPALGPNKVSMKEYWFGATKVLGLGSNKLVLGNRVRNVNLGNPDPSAAEWNNLTAMRGRLGVGGGTQWPWTFSTAVAAYSDSNLLVANNLLGKATSKATMPFQGKQVPYPYDNRYGIDINKILLGGAYGHLVPGANPGDCSVGTPKTFEWSFRPGLVVRGNYVFQNGRVGITFSGGGDGKTVGSGTQIVNNHVEVAKDTTFYGFAPDKPPHGADTNENRGYDQSGIENNVTANSGNINRQKIGGSSYETVDGEGLLVQCTNGNNQFRNVWRSNDFSKGTSGYVAYYGIDLVEDCVLEDNVAAPGNKVGFFQISSSKKFEKNSCHANHPACSCAPAKGVPSCKWD